MGASKSSRALATYTCAPERSQRKCGSVDMCFSTPRKRPGTVLAEVAGTGTSGCQHTVSPRRNAFNKVMGATGFPTHTAWWSELDPKGPHGAKRCRSDSISSGSNSVVSVTEAPLASRCEVIDRNGPRWGTTMRHGSLATRRFSTGSNPLTVAPRPSRPVPNVEIRIGTTQFCRSRCRSVNGPSPPQRSMAVRSSPVIGTPCSAGNGMCSRWGQRTNGCSGCLSNHAATGTGNLRTVERAGGG